MKRKILLRCDSGNLPEIGTGHLKRCLLLADELKKHKADIVFLTLRTETEDVLKKNGYRVIRLTSEDVSDVKNVITEEKPDVVVWDRLHTDAALMKAIKQTKTVLINLDDEAEGGKEADILINAMMPGGDTIYKGFEYAIFPPVKLEVPTKAAQENITVTFCFGGYDHAGLTIKALSAVKPLATKIKINVIVGSGYSDFDALAALCKQIPSCTLLKDPANFNEVLMTSDIALVAGGLTLVQALSYGVPCIGIAQYEHQLNTLKRFAAGGAVINLGKAGDLKESDLQSHLEKLMRDSSAREKLSRRGRLAVDGYGLQRVKRLILVVDKLEWDSQFFGKPIATLYPMRINEDIVNLAFRKCQEESIQCLYYLCDCHDSKSVRLAEEHGFTFVDIRITFNRDLNTVDDIDVSKLDYKVRSVEKSDIPQIKAIAATSYIDSRYYFDRHFSREICEKFYSEWVEKSAAKEHVIVAERQGKILGYITCVMKNSVSGVISLVGVDKEAAGTGVGKTLVRKSLAWFKEQGAEEVEVVTQGRNYMAQRLYQSGGFKTKKTELWYHKWFQ